MEYFDKDENSVSSIARSFGCNSLNPIVSSDRSTYIKPQRKSFQGERAGWHHSWSVSVALYECRLCGSSSDDTLYSIVQGLATVISGVIIGTIFAWRLGLVGLACAPPLVSAGYIRLVCPFFILTSHERPLITSYSVWLSSKTNTTRKHTSSRRNSHVKPPALFALSHRSLGRMIAAKFTARH